MDDATPTDSVGPAFYAQPRFLRSRAARDWWTVLHPPYTLCHLSFVVVGASLAGTINVYRLLMTLLAFFLAVGLGAHILDELMGRPLKTAIPKWQLIVVAIGSLLGAVILGVVGVVEVSNYLIIFIAVGLVIALGYNLELLGGRFHNGLTLALGWGSFPVLTSFFAQHGRLNVGAFVGATYAALITLTQRQLSTPARELRRRVQSVNGVMTRTDGSTSSINVASLLAPLEKSLRTLCWAAIAIAIALAIVNK
jgi:hypothetical protein